VFFTIGEKSVMSRMSLVIYMMHNAKDFWIPVCTMAGTLHDLGDQMIVLVATLFFAGRQELCHLY
jgi:hypothetical protein